MYVHRCRCPDALVTIQYIHTWLLCVWTNVSLSGLRDTGTSTSYTNSVQFKRLQVLNMWREIQQLEEEINEKLVCTVTTTATEKHIKVLKVLGDKLLILLYIFLSHVEYVCLCPLS